MPINAATGGKASSTDAATWTTFERATQALGADDSLGGVGFVFSEDDPHCGIDLDDCIDKDGNLSSEALGIIQALNSYCEISPSRQGIKVFVRAVLPVGIKHVARDVPGMKQIELYDSRRYFTVTGQIHSGTVAQIGDRQGAVEALIERHGLNPPARTMVSRSNLQVDSSERVRRCKAYLEKCPDAISGSGGHDATLRAACECYRFGLDQSEAAAVMSWFNDQKTGGERWTDREIQHKLDSARAKVELSGEIGSRLIDPPPSSDSRIYSTHEESRSISTATERSRLCTDVGNAARLVKRCGNDLRYCYAIGSWFQWDGVRWKPDEVGHIDKMCIETALSIKQEAVLAGGYIEETLNKWATQSQKRERITAMKELAKPDLAIRIETFDSGLDILNCQNGTVELRTGTLREHRREDYITKIAPTDFVPDAACPLFIKFLREITDENESLIGYLQRYFGHVLTGNANEQVLLIFHGEGGNGKNVLLDTISSVMGNYACEAPPNLLVVRKQREHPTEIADLQGARLVVASENEKDAELNLALIKMLTGNQRLKARRMRQDFFEFHRTHKLVLLTNDLPILRERGEAARRRIRVVPFPVVIPESSRDPSLLERLIEERSGILAWLVRGAVEWAQNGLGTCEAVTQATEGYIGSVSGLDIFFEEMCEFDLYRETPTSEIMAAQTQWSKRKGCKPATYKELAKGLHRRQCKSGKRNDRRIWRGISLRPEHSRTDRTDRTDRTGDSA
ncbi:MAG: hypothetical protein KDA31_12135 [Phycisphaerales bacterium]|nr:hypothetical protein [Phycisphaerales bacterium]MCB9836753.1 hypothetical protein [Phycisphaera sp.]